MKSVPMRSPLRRSAAGKMIAPGRPAPTPPTPSSVSVTPTGDCPRLTAPAPALLARPVAGLVPFPEGGGRGTGVGLQQALAAQANGGQDLVVPEDVAARPPGLAHQLLVQADRLARLGIVLGRDFQPGPAGEFAQGFLGKLG